MVFKSTFSSTVAVNKNYIKGLLNCSPCNALYLKECSNCEDHYVGSALNFKKQLKIHKFDIKTNKNRCGTA